MTVMISMTSEEKPGVTRTPAEVIMSIEKSPAHKELRNVWTVDQKAFEAQKWDQEEEARQLRFGAYYVAGMSLIFQAIIFMSVAQTNLLHCSLVWSPISLSAIVGLGSMLAVADKLYELGIVKNEINRTDANINALVSMLDLLDKEGADLDLDHSRPCAYVHYDTRAGLKEVMSWYGLLAQFFLFSFSMERWRRRRQSSSPRGTRAPPPFCTETPPSLPY